LRRWLEFEDSENLALEKTRPRFYQMLHIQSNNLRQTLEQNSKNLKKAKT
jgi:hypothetical protein